LLLPALDSSSPLAVARSAPSLAVESSNRAISLTASSSAKAATNFGLAETPSPADNTPSSSIPQAHLTPSFLSPRRNRSTGWYPPKPHPPLDAQGNPNLNINNHIAPSPSLPVLDHLASQPNKYIIARLHDRRLLLHARNTIAIQRLKPAPPLGSKLNLSRILEVGSRDYNLAAPKGERLMGVKCEAVVLEHTTGPVEILNKKKRRKGYKKQIRSQQLYTVLRVGDIEVVGTETAEDEKARERTLTQPARKHFDEYAATDMSVRARLARKYGIV
jgi:large subunit ribosomal protein L21